MEENRFFKLVWRINGLLILVVVAVILTFILYQVINDLTRSGHGSEPVVVENIADDPENKEKWVLGNPMRIGGNDYILIPLVSENKEVKLKSASSFAMASYDRYIKDPSKNLLFMNKSSNESFWLFEDTSRLILDVTIFPNDYNEEKPTKAIFYNVVSLDSNGDKKLSYEDDSSLYISSPEGKNYELVLEAYDKIISRSSVGDNQVMLIYQDKGKAFSKLIQLSPYEVISTNELPKIKNS